jgi:GT2 family glycosyltransferase
VVIVSWNCAAALRRCLQAIEKAKGREDLEVLVVDTGSLDGCEKIDSEFPWITALRLPRNFGKTRARNIAVRTVTGEYILLLSPEVELEAEAIGLLSGVLQACPEVAAVSASLCSPEGAAIQLAYKLPETGALREACRGSRRLAAEEGGDTPEGLVDHALLVRKQALRAMNYFEEKRFSQYWADLEMCFQIRNAGKKLRVEPEARGVLHPPTFSVRLDPGANDLLDADCMLGAANYVEKHEGFVAGMTFRLGCIVSSLTRPRRLVALVTGQRIDGTQGGVLA